MDWQQLYLEGTTPWDHGAPAPPLLEWLESHPGEMRGAVFVPGCGRGHDLRAIAAAAEARPLVGLDISEKAVEEAGRFPRVGGERYEVGDLFALPPRHLGAYDWVWEHTCFCAIDPGQRPAYADAVHAVLKPGGRLLGVFYLDPYDEEHRPGEGPPHGSELEEIVSLLESDGRFALEEDRLPARAYQGREGRERLLRFRKEG